MKVLQFQAGKSVIIKGATNSGEFYIVKKGTLHITGDEYEEKELSRFEAGDSFGLVSALTHRRYLATIVAATPAEVIRIPVTQLGKFLKENRKTCVKLLMLYSRELRILLRYLGSVNVATEWDNTPAKLLQDAEYYKENGLSNMAAHALQVYLLWIKENPDQLSTGSRDAALKMKMGLPTVDIIDHDSPASIELQKEDVLFLENEPSDFFYVVKSGSIRVSKIVKGSEFVINVIGAGEILGEMALLEGTCRLASAVADDHSEILKLTYETFHSEVGEAILQSIFESICRRIWMTHRRISLLKINDASTRLFAMLELMVQESEFKGAFSGADANLKMNVTLVSLKVMTGIIRVKDATIKQFLENKNLDIHADHIIIKNRKVLASTVRGFQAKFKGITELYV